MSVIHALAVISFGVLVAGVVRLGEAVSSLSAGVAAGVIVALSHGVLSNTSIAAIDIPFVALVVWAAALEARTARRGAPVLWLLGLAGLLRPEAWLLAGAYWLYLVWKGERRSGVRLAVLVAAPPLAWALLDLAVTGDPLHSLGRTREVVAEAGFETGLGAVPDFALDSLRLFLRWPVLIAAGAGIALAVGDRHRPLALPLGLAAIGVAWFAVVGLLEGPLVSRYLLLPATMLAVAAGHAVAGWVGQPSRAPGRIVLGVALIGLALAAAPSQERLLGGLRTEMEVLSDSHDDLRRLADSAGFEQRLEPCGRVIAPSHRLVPVLLYRNELPLARVPTLQESPSPRGLAIVPSTPAVARAWDIRQEYVTDDDVLASGFRRVEGTPSWGLYERGCGPS